MRSGLLLAVFVMAAGCVDPGATVEEPSEPPTPPVPVEPIVVEPVFDLMDMSGVTTRQIMLGGLVTLNASATPTDNLTSLRYLWLEQGDMLMGGTMWPRGPYEAQVLEPTLIMPGSEGTHRLTVVAESETGHTEQRVVHVGVSVEEEWSWDLAAASPLGAPEPCEPAFGLLGDPASVEQAFLVHEVHEAEGAVFAVRAASGVHAQWCQDGSPREGFVTPDGGIGIVIEVDEAWTEIVLWVANIDAQEVVVNVTRSYAGDPRH